jgi:hypothetical protein
MSLPTYSDESEDPDALNQLTEDPDAWVKTQIDKSRSRVIRLTHEEESVIPALIEQATNFAGIEQVPSGFALAAVFDLCVSIHYYAQTANTGWLYCPAESPLLIHNFGMNVCPRCVLDGRFHFYEANKLASGSIGKITRRLLGVFLVHLFERAGRKLEVRIASEPVDIIVYDRASQTALLAEAKSGPLTILPLAQDTETQTEVGPEGNISPRPHSRTDNSHLLSKDMSLMLPVREDGTESVKYIRLSPFFSGENRLTWAHDQIRTAFLEQPQNLTNYFHFWKRAFATYESGRREPIASLYWWTGASGSPNHARRIGRTGVPYPTRKQPSGWTARTI